MITRTESFTAVVVVLASKRRFFPALWSYVVGRSAAGTWNGHRGTPQVGEDHPQGLSDERRQFREAIRLKAGERFAVGEPSSVIAKELRISVRSLQRWRRAWDQGGPRTLRSTGSASLPRLSEAQFAALEEESGGWPDQRWTLSRIKTVIGRRFRMSYVLQGVRRLLIRNGRQVIVDPAGHLNWASAALPGSVHDLTVARTRGIIGALSSAI